LQASAFCGKKQETKAVRLIAVLIMIFFMKNSFTKMGCVHSEDISERRF